MFCPECKSEYRPGFTHCSDCNVDLVAERPKPQSDVNLSKLSKGLLVKDFAGISQCAGGFGVSIRVKRSGLSKSLQKISK
jgi:hypothetical protein